MGSSADQPRWLDDEQQRIWRLYLAGNHRIFTEMENGLRPFNLDLGEYEILVNLSESSDRSLRMSDLASRVRQSRSRLTHTVGRMESKGLLERVPCDTDGRGVRAILTEAGYNLLVEAAPFHVESVRDALVDAVHPDDYVALGRVMQAVVDRT